MSANAWTETADGWTAGSGDSDADGSTGDADGSDWDGGAHGWGSQRGTVPTGVLVSTHDVTIRHWAERDHNVVRWTELDRGGHFLAMEAPDLLIADLREFFRKLR